MLVAGYISLHTNLSESNKSVHVYGEGVVFSRNTVSTAAGSADSPETGDDLSEREACVRVSVSVCGTGSALAQ